MAYHDYTRLINKFSDDVTISIPSNGGYDKYGIWQENEPTEITIKGAVIAFKENTVYRSEGNIKAQDKRLLTVQPIDKALDGAIATHKGKKYSINQMSDNSQFTGCYSYLLSFIFGANFGGN